MISNVISNPTLRLIPTVNPKETTMPTPQTANPTEWILRTGGVLIACLIGLSLAWAQHVNRHQAIQIHQMQGMLQRIENLGDRTDELRKRLEASADRQTVPVARHRLLLLAQFTVQMEGTLTQMRDLGEACNRMVRDRDLNLQIQVQDEMNRLRLHLNNVTSQLEDAVRTVERLEGLVESDGPGPLSSLTSPPR